MGDRNENFKILFISKHYYLLVKCGFNYRSFWEVLTPNLKLKRIINLGKIKLATKLYQRIIWGLAEVKAQVESGVLLGMLLMLSF